MRQPLFLHTKPPLRRGGEPLAVEGFFASFHWHVRGEAIVGARTWRARFWHNEGIVVTVAWGTKASPHRRGGPKGRRG